MEEYDKNHIGGSNAIFLEDGIWKIKLRNGEIIDMLNKKISIDYFLDEEIPYCINNNIYLVNFTK